MALVAPSILVPLYFYPETAETWGPLYTAIDTYPHVEFVVIINPSSGPGVGSTPDARYSEEIPKLNSKSNVKTVGYIPTGYGDRDLSLVLQDIATYAGWSEDAADNDDASGIYVEGVFFDETPNVYTDAIGAFYEGIDREVKENAGYKGDRTIIHNPGTVPDSRLAALQPDITVTFEQSYNLYQSTSTHSMLDRSISSGDYNRSSSSLIVHSVPIDQIETLTLDLVKRAEYVFVTDLTEDYYNSFGPGWERFVEAVAGISRGDASGAIDEKNNEAIAVPSDASTTNTTTTSISTSISTAATSTAGAETDSTPAATAAQTKTCGLSKRSRSRSRSRSRQ